MSVKLAIVAVIILLHPKSGSALNISKPTWSRVSAAASEARASMQIEVTAERHPYVVALVNTTRGYECSGVVLDDLWVLTSGACARRNLTYILVGAAIINKFASNIIRIAAVHIHPDHAFDTTGPKQFWKINNDLGLVLAQYPVLEEFIEAAALSIAHSNELIGKEVELVGYGKGLGKRALRVLHAVPYTVKRCNSDSWSYCVCGITNSTETFDAAWGGPVLLDSKVVGIANLPAGSRGLSINGTSNVFTILRPYLPWIEREIMTKQPAPDLKSLLSSYRSGTSSLCSYVSSLLPATFIQVLIYKIIKIA